MESLIQALTSNEVQRFIQDNENADVQKILLSKKQIHGVTAPWIAYQIQGRRKAKEKVPSWYSMPGIIYPASLSLEQCSSEATAKLKSEFVQGNRLADLSGGFGVDTLYFSRTVSQIDYVEPDLDLLAIARHNHQLFGANNIRYHQTTAENFLESSRESFDFLFLDPSRRAGERKVFMLPDGKPNVLALKTLMLEKANQTIIKASPLLDLKQAYRELGKVEKFVVVASENECKELLIFLGRQAGDEPSIQAHDLHRSGAPTIFTFNWSAEKKAVAKFSSPQAFLYEPNAAILKAGAFRLMAQTYKVAKLAVDTHLYTSSALVSEFPGRVFKILEQVTLDKKLMKRFDGGYANILRRNHPLTVATILKKTGLKEGGQHYLICTRGEKPVALVAERLK